jgi:5-methylcytosine-specific restriction endonuclease McrA
MPKRPRPRCPKHQAEFEAKRNARLAALPNKATYRTAAWKKPRAAALERAAHRCERCGISGDHTILDTHHKLSTPEHALDAAELEVLCRSCHVSAGHRARKEREARGRW